MPRYVYRCSECEQAFEVVHSFGEEMETCSQINEESKCSSASVVKRVPQGINLVNKQKQKSESKVGQIVDDYIRDTKKEVEEYKEEMKNWSPKKCS